MWDKGDNRMTVRELIAELEKCEDKEADVMVDNGDEDGLLHDIGGTYLSPIIKRGIFIIVEV